MWPPKSGSDNWREIKIRVLSGPGVGNVSAGSWCDFADPGGLPSSTEWTQSAGCGPGTGPENLRGSGGGFQGTGRGCRDRRSWKGLEAFGGSLRTRDRDFAYSNP